MFVNQQRDKLISVLPLLIDCQRLCHTDAYPRFLLPFIGSRFGGALHLPIPVPDGPRV